MRLMVQGVGVTLEQEIERLHADGDIALAERTELINRIQNAVSLMLTAVAGIEYHRRTRTARVEQKPT